jgi:prepilin-type N-terminal cleavage/methylation domain-containing protein
MKKGFTIIEVIVAMGIGITILLIEINMLSTQAIKYKKFIKADREESYCREALRFIEGEVYALDNKSVKVNEDTIIIKKT